MPRETKTLGVRLTEKERALIEDKARAAGLRPSTYAKKALLEAALGEDAATQLPDVRDRLDELEEELGKLRRALRNSVLKLLTTSRPLSAKDANAWAKERLE